MTPPAPVASNDPQAEVIAYLEAPGTLCLDDEPRRIDTHAARIFLAGDRAWKLKRSVRFGYLDFSSPEKRRLTLEKELLLNRRTAPDLYLAVRPIRRNDDGLLNFGDDGEPIDWLLEMRRFPDDALLEQVAARGALTEPLVLRLTDRIKSFHDSAEQVRSHSGRERIEAVIAGNRESMATYPEILPPDSAGRLIQRQQVLAERHARLLDIRAAAGRVRHAHGDLHLANIAMIDDEPVLFDCLEFSAVLATIDVLYDLAFLLMDLWAKGCRVEANMLFNRYLDVSPEDEDAVVLIPLFLSIRAAVRAHVAAAQANGDPSSALRKKAEQYLSLAHELLAPGPTRLVAIGGLSGTGKSTIARLVAYGVGSAPGARILRSDVLRKRLAGLPPETPLSKEAYSTSASAAVYAELERLAQLALNEGRSLIVDAVYARPDERRAIAQVAAQKNVPFAGIWLDAPSEVLKARIAARVNDASDADVAVAGLQAHYDLGAMDWRRVSAEGDRGVIADRVRSALAVA
ncbi:bifunctional aminoglycoside phosphotransferase/ATP-binding protein [Sphingobium sp.]|uniref:bifunctional aminoglycoside phosphotransferase/ATP-binding protein n=1 Tax=Sphingobium sp. TaxID=1912891 RepID=UPI000C4E7A6E|nr:bifunctional aminoglycoside phosphotransferase/ATP-binding protein [Sphingobium sp.]MBS88196.1 aminoglycoside phosphotransferase [Sphingobium sp.]